MMSPARTGTTAERASPSDSSSPRRYRHALGDSISDVQFIVYCLQALTLRLRLVLQLLDVLAAALG